MEGRVLTTLTTTLAHVLPDTLEPSAKPLSVRSIPLLPSLSAVKHSNTRTLNEGDTVGNEKDFYVCGKTRDFKLFFISF